jgi:dTDP-4-dehydrorhamnose 3,5-epimerase
MGIKDRFVQDNHSRSVRNVLRGLHYQINRPQSKLCRVVQGEVLDVIVDIRRGSPRFGKYERVHLSADNKRQVYVPAGFAHGYVVLSETAEFLYKCSDFYFPEYERGIIWDDPQIRIDWGTQSPILSDKDRNNLPLSQVPAHDLPEFEQD